jgi:hypothetical protein
MTDDDVLLGATPIVDYLNKICGTSNWNERKVYYAAETGRLPIGHLGSFLVSRKSAINQAISNAAAGAQITLPTGPAEQRRIRRRRK